MIRSICCDALILGSLLYPICPECGELCRTYEDKKSLPEINLEENPLNRDTMDGREVGI